MLFNFNEIKPAVMPCIVFNNSEIGYTTKLRFFASNITEN